MKIVDGYTTGDGRWFRHSNEDGTDKRGLKSVEFAWKVGEFGPNLGFYYQTGHDYNAKRKWYFGFLFGRVWITWVAKTKNRHDDMRWGIDLGRKTFYYWLGSQDSDCNTTGKYGFFMWRDRLLDLIFGRTQHLCDKQNRSWEIINSTVSMPEGEYPCTLTKETRLWMRPRWPFRLVRYGIDIEIPCGIPFSGKGENDWDCGEDGLYGCGISSKSKSEGWNIQRAVNHARESAIKDRLRRDGTVSWAMPASERVKIFNERRIKEPTQ